MSCKMVDAMIEANPDTWTWYSINSPFKVQQGPNIHPAVSDNTACQIAKAYRLRHLPQQFQPPLDPARILAVMRERARARR